MPVDEKGARKHRLSASQILEYNRTIAPEVLALRDAAAALGTWRLDDCTLVVTVEKGVNDNSMERAIVIHAAAYVSDPIAKTPP
jgi:hypothetical protein